MAFDETGRPSFAAMQDDRRAREEREILRNDEVRLLETLLREFIEFCKSGKTKDP